MSLYNMLFGRNSNTDMVLAIIGLKECDIQRLRNCSIEDDGKTISVYTRTGGGNREDYPNNIMRKRPEWKSSYDDDFDNTYCDDHFNVPTEFINDAANLDNILEHGIRPEFMQHIAKTLNREPTEEDVRSKKYNYERHALSKTDHTMLNGHTFVPHDSHALETALELAEQNEDGDLLSCWGIGCLKLNIKQNTSDYPHSDKAEFKCKINRASIRAIWETDTDYLQHIKDFYQSKYPKAVAKIIENSNPYIKDEA